jgi:hypothetical protein
MSDQIIPLEAEFTLLKKDLRGIKRRAAIRYRSALATLGKLIFPESTETWDAWISNLSETGVGLNLSAALEAGRPLVLLLKLPTQRLTLRLPARVIHSTPEVDGTWRVGCEFANKLTPEELDALL